eukprot:scaffold2043_cov166-Amphora_coffeaeformis.AAC.10
MFARQLRWLFLLLSLGPFTSMAAKALQQPQQAGASPTPSLSLRPRVVSLNIMVAGLSGLGKTTTCEALLESWIQQQGITLKSDSESSTRNKKIKFPLITRVVDPSRQFERMDPDTNTLLRVRIIDTPGFGNRVDHRDAVKPIARYMHQCRRNQFRAETSSKLPERDVVEACDDLVHVCLYFLSPGRFLEMDAYFLRRIQKEVCIIPVIAKADTLTNEELTYYRSELTKAFAREEIEPYNFDNKRPGMIAGGNTNNTELYKDGILPESRGRRAGEALAIISRDGKYPWGEIRSVNPVHSDLILVRDLLLSQHTQTFVEMARNKYGDYRARRIQRRNIGDALKVVALGLLTARALGIQIPFMENLTPQKFWGQITKLFEHVSRFFAKAYRSVVPQAVPEVAPPLPEIIPDVVPEAAAETTDSLWSWFGWGKK